MQSAINKLQERRRESEEGFTLIELMVVVLIIAILLAIAIPTFLGARARAQDRAAQSSLRNTLTAAKTIYTDNQSYTIVTPGASGTLKATEPSLTFEADATGSNGPKVISSAAAPAADTFTAAAKSDSGKCFYIKDVASTTGGTTYLSATPAAGAVCKSTDAGTYGANW
jgi:type IV pilus assembly protein PilA